MVQLANRLNRPVHKTISNRCEFSMARGGLLYCVNAELRTESVHRLVHKFHVQTNQYGFADPVELDFDRPAIR